MSRTVVSAITADSRVDAAALRGLSASFTGELAGPGDPTYDELRKVWNGSIDRIPALIARCRGVAGVIAGQVHEETAASRSPPSAVEAKVYPGHSVCYAIVGAVNLLGLEIRAGVHTGEVEMINNKLGGVAVNIGARIAAIAGPGEVLVSSTVKDLTAGSGLAFEDAGEHELKGIPGPWRIFRVAAPAPA